MYSNTSRTSGMFQFDNASTYAHMHTWANNSVDILLTISYNRRTKNNREITATVPIFPYNELSLSYSRNIVFVLYLNIWSFAWQQQTFIAHQNISDFYAGFYFIGVTMKHRQSESYSPYNEKVQVGWRMYFYYQSSEDYKSVGGCISIIRAVKDTSRLEDDVSTQWWTIRAHRDVFNHGIFSRIILQIWHHLKKLNVGR